MRYKLNKIVSAMFFMLLSLSVIVPFAQAQNSKDTLNQYVADLQKNPTKPGFREEIIKFVQGMNPKPAIPAEAVRFADRGEYAAKIAKTETDYMAAADEYLKATLLAPWVADYYFNEGVLLEKTKNGELTAITNFKLYLLVEPNAKDAREVQKRIAGLEYAAEQAAKGPSPEAVASQEANDPDAWIKKLNGVSYIYDSVSPVQMIDIKDGMLIRSCGSSSDFGAGHEFGRSQIHSHIVELGQMYIFRINEDGQSIEEDHPGDPYNPPFTFRRSN